VAGAGDPFALVSGANARRWLLAAWAAPDWRRRGEGGYREGDLLGAGALAALLLAMPFARPGSELAGGRDGRAAGLVVGLASTGSAARRRRRAAGSL